MSVLGKMPELFARAGLAESFVVMADELVRNCAEGTSEREIDIVCDNLESDPGTRNELLQVLYAAYAESLTQGEVEMLITWFKHPIWDKLERLETNSISIVSMFLEQKLAEAQLQMKHGPAIQKLKANMGIK